jgi:ribonuclease BN (tRNA processing enzyme)
METKRDFLKKISLLAASGLVIGSCDKYGNLTLNTGIPDKKEGENDVKNPNGGRPNSGISIPPYYQPTPSVKNPGEYFPGSEELGPDEMRISFLGSSPEPPTRAQAGTCIMVELGNGKRFFFDAGPGCMRNMVAMQVPLALVNDIFITHLHIDHYGELPYIYCFSPSMGRWKPLRVTGPSGRTPKDGTKAMIEHMKGMVQWNTDAFHTFPTGDGFDIEVNEFDFRDDNGICYDKDGVVIRHWRRIHNKDGASAYRLEWNGLSFVYTGDGRPDELTIRYGKNADVFVSEVIPDTMNIQALKYGLPVFLGTACIDGAAGGHTVHYAAGYIFNQVQPRLAMGTHMQYEEEMIPEVVSGIRVHYGGLFQFGAPDGVVVNVTKDAIWTRKAVIGEFGNFAGPTPKEATELYDLSPTKTEIVLPNPVHKWTDLVEKAGRDQEIDPRLYYPPGVYREPNGIIPDGLRIDASAIVNAAALAASAGSQADSLSKLERLAKLKDQGFLSEEEFTAQKAKILNA